MISFFTGCLDLIFMWFSADSWVVVLPFCVMVFCVIVMFVYKLARFGDKK